jgi:large subunit ribosomal protein L28
LACIHLSPRYNAWLDFEKHKEPEMPRVCYFTGKKTTFGNQITHRGKAKYLGGVGTKVTGITSRKFKPNIQKVRAVVDGQVVRIKVSAKALRNGFVTKPVRRKWVKPAAAVAASAN